MVRRYLLLLIMVMIANQSNAQRLVVSQNNRYLVTDDGNPFFWLADTAWELFHRCDRKEADMCLQKQIDQGFTVIRAVILAELDGLNTPNPYGHVDYILGKADELGLYIAVLPTWGDKVNTKNWGKGPEVFDPQNAFLFGKWIGNRYKESDHIIWITGGDRNPRPNSNDVEICRFSITDRPGMVLIRKRIEPGTTPLKQTI